MSLVKTELKTFVADIQHDNGATVVRKTAICQAPDRATAASRIAREVEKTSEESLWFWRHLRMERQSDFSRETPVIWRYPMTFLRQLG